MQKDLLIVRGTHHCYFSVAAIPCDVCREVFPTGCELLSHFRKTDHKTLRYSCPWCASNEFKYSFDLRRHVRTKHPKEHDRMPSRLLSTDNLIYCSNNPEILREHEKVAPYNSDEARLMRQLISSQARQQGTLDRWEKRWQLLETGKPRQVKRKSGFTILHVTMDSAGATVTVQMEEKIMRAILTPHYIQSQRVLSKITRLLTCLPESTELPPGRWEEDSSLVSDLSDTLNIDKTLIACTQLLQPPSFTELAPPSPLTFDDLRSPSPVSLKEAPYTSTETQEDDTDPYMTYLDSPKQPELPACPDQHQQTRLQAPESPRSSTSSIPYIPTPILPTDSLKVSARALLMTGRLPLLPPGRRDWNSVHHAQVSFPNNMTWPPSNWQSLTPDQRTLLTEHLCTSLILHKRQPIPSRAELLLRYQALLLPGSAIRPSNNPFVRMLEANYHMVHAIASGQCRSSLDLQRKTLDTFTSIDEDSSDEDIMKAIKDVPLRL